MNYHYMGGYNYVWGPDIEAANMCIVVSLQVTWTSEDFPSMTGDGSNCETTICGGGSKRGLDCMV
jgi:hypothetical protein